MGFSFYFQAKTRVLGCLTYFKMCLKRFYSWMGFPYLKVDKGAHEKLLSAGYRSHYLAGKQVFPKQKVQS